jgi:hypothetical protein
MTRSLLLFLTILATSLVPVGVRAAIPGFVVPGVNVTYTGTYQASPTSTSESSSQTIIVNTVNSNTGEVTGSTVINTEGQPSVQLPWTCTTSGCSTSGVQIAQFWVDPNNPTGSIYGPLGQSQVYQKQPTCSISNSTCLTYSDMSVTLELAYNATGLVTFYSQYAPNNTTQQGHTNIYTYNFSQITSPGPVAGANLVLQDVNNGDVAVWQMSGISIVDGGIAVDSGGNVVHPGSTWQIVGTGDFFGRGSPSDIVFQNSSSGQFVIWEMNGNSIVGGGSVTLSGSIVNPPSTWRVVGTGNFYGNGLSDIVLQNVDGEVVIWEMSGTSIIGGGRPTLDGAAVDPGSVWRGVGSGDFYGRGLSDIIFQNTINGQVVIWEMSGTTIIGGGSLTLNGVVETPGATWQVVGTGDFTGIRLLAKSSGPVPPLPYGVADIVFQNTTTGEVAIWEMNGTSIGGGGGLTLNGVVEIPGAAWKVVGTGDFYGRDRSDILFQTVNGQSLNDQPPVIWEMDGTSIIGGGAITNPGAGWLLFTSNELSD